jgi:hypothetical protein
MRAVLIELAGRVFETLVVENQKLYCHDDERKKRPVPGDCWRLFRLGLTVYMLMLSTQLSLRLRCRTGGALTFHFLCTLLT